jgi:hypothetical protein
LGWKFVQKCEEENLSEKFSAEKRSFEEPIPGVLDNAALTSGPVETRNVEIATKSAISNTPTIPRTSPAMRNLKFKSSCKNATSNDLRFLHVANYNIFGLFFGLFPQTHVVQQGNTHTGLLLILLHDVVRHNGTQKYLFL